MTPHSIQPLTLKRTTMMTMMVAVMVVITLMLTMLIALMVTSLRMRMVMMAGMMCPSFFPIRGELAVVAICCFSQNHCNFSCTAIAFATTTTTSTTGWVVPGSGIRLEFHCPSSRSMKLRLPTKMLWAVPFWAGGGIEPSEDPTAAAGGDGVGPRALFEPITGGQMLAPPSAHEAKPISAAI